MAIYSNSLPTQWQAGDQAIFTNTPAAALSLPAGRYTILCKGAGGAVGSSAYDSATSTTYTGGNGGNGALAQGEFSFSRRTQLAVRPGAVNTVAYYQNFSGSVPKLAGASYVAKNGMVLLGAGCGGRGENGAGAILYLNGSSGRSAYGTLFTEQKALSEYTQYDNVNTGLSPVNTKNAGGSGQTQSAAAQAGSVSFTLLELFDPLPIFVRVGGVWQEAATALVRQNGTWVEAGVLLKSGGSWE